MPINITKLRTALQAKADASTQEMFIAFSTASLVLFALVIALHEATARTARDDEDVE